MSNEHQRELAAPSFNSNKHHDQNYGTMNQSNDMNLDSEEYDHQSLSDDNNSSLSTDHNSASAKKTDLEHGYSAENSDDVGYTSGQWKPRSWKELFSTEYLFGGTKDAFLGRNLPSKTRLGNEEGERIVWNKGFHAFFKSVGIKLKDIFTVRFLICLVAGQFLSVCLTGTNVLTTELGTHGWSLPATQSWFVYFILLVIYMPLTLYKYGFRAYFKMILKDGWKYIFLAAVDVEANFLVVKAYQYTTLLSCELLDAWATPACMIFSYFLVRNRYHWSQVLGVIVAIGGLALLVASDLITGKNYSAPNPGLGDGLMVIGATLYGLSNSLEEMLVKERPLYEVLGQLGLWGVLILGAQAAGLEHDQYKKMKWNGGTAGFLVGYTACMIGIYSTAPVLFRLSSSPFYNISVLTSDFYGLLFGLVLFHYHPYWLYFIAYAVVLVGLIIYFCYVRPEETQNFKVEARGRQKDREENQANRFVLGY